MIDVINEAGRLDLINEAEDILNLRKSDYK